MTRLHLRAPSPALVVSVVALVVALGGTSYAAFSLPKNSVGTKQLKTNAVTARKIKNGSVTASKIDTSGLTVPNAQHANHANSADSATDATNAASATNATDAAELGGAGASAYVKSAGVIPAGDLAGTYGSPTIAAGAVTGAKVAANSLTGANIDESTLSGIGAGVMTGRVNTLSASIVNGGPPVGTSTGTSALVSTYQTVSPSVALVARDFTFRLSAPPGTGASRDMEFVVGSGATVMCTISGSATSCTAPGPVSLPAGTTFSVQTEPHSSPAAADLSFGYLLTTP
jgi:hypothetical protein